MQSTPFYEVDLHTHTYYSDGRASPAELAERAAALGIKVLAIADHDSARGAREALPIAEQLGIRLIPAMECTCRWDACRMSPEESDIDVLGYFVDLESSAFHQVLPAHLPGRAGAESTLCRHPPVDSGCGGERVLQRQCIC